MTDAEYRRHPGISRSELWYITESPQKFQYLQNNPREATPALLFGQAFHKMILEPDGFSEEFIVAPEVDRRTKEGKQRWAEFLDEAEGKTIITTDMYNQATEMCAAIMAEPLAAKLLDAPREIPFFWQDEITGEECKCRVDCLNRGYSQPIIVDVKSTGDASTEMFIRDAVKYGYDFQSAMYCTGVERNIMEKPLFVFIAVEKAPPYAVNILQADELLLRRGEGIYRNCLDIYHDCKLTGNWYGYLGKQKQINNLALPAWAAKEME